MNDDKLNINSVSFSSVLLLAGKTATGIQVPDEVVAKLGDSKKPAVLATLNGYTYRTTVATMTGKYMLPVSAEVRNHAKIVAGDNVTVNLELDLAPREVTIPDDFRQALSANTNAEKLFDSLSYSNQRRFVLSIEGAKTMETRQRRIEKSVGDLASRLTQAILLANP